MRTSELARDFASDLRPETWDAVYGQDAVIMCLKTYCTTARPPKAIMFTGEYGIGKSSLARLTAKSMSCSGRRDDDPNPCGHCTSCLAFGGSFWSFSTMVVPPQTSADQFSRAVVTAMRGTASLFKEDHRPTPVYMDDLDEHPKAQQQFLKRALDSRWNGFIVAATTKPEKIEAGLLDRFQIFRLQRPDMSAVVPWMKAIARRLGFGSISEEAARTLAGCGSMNYRKMLKILQVIHGAGLSFTAANIANAMLIAGWSTGEINPCSETADRPPV